MKLNALCVNSISLRALMFFCFGECCLNCLTDHWVLNEAMLLGTKQQDEEMKRSFKDGSVHCLADEGLFSMIFVKFMSKSYNH